MNVLTSPSDIYDYVTAQKHSGRRVGFVPTMGCLHEGHLSLVRSAKAQCQRVVVSIFVNPLQFGAGEDLSRYPRPFEADCAKLAACGVDAVFAPESSVIYPEGSMTFVDVPSLADKLCGAFRPGHFRGVTTIVAKLFHLVPADVAFFGAKDWQQQVLIRKMVSDLNFPIEVVTCPIVREPDGLAMSSRNTYLDPESRALATRLYQALVSAKTAISAGEYSSEAVRKKMQTVLKAPHSAQSTLQIQYITLCDPQTLDPAETILPGTLIALAVIINGVRLIDNWLVSLTFG